MLYSFDVPEIKMWLCIYLAIILYPMPYCENHAMIGAVSTTSNLRRFCDTYVSKIGAWGMEGSEYETVSTFTDGS